MNISLLSQDEIQARYEIKDVKKTVKDIVDTHGIDKMHELALLGPQNALALQTRKDLMRNLCIFQAWGATDEAAYTTDYILARCVILDELAPLTDPVKGSYVFAAPFLLALKLFSKKPVDDWLDGISNMADDLSA